MAHAYTPGLTVTAHTSLKRLRRLPIAGEVLVDNGATVGAADPVARTELPGNVQTVNLAGQLGVEPADIDRVLVKRQGDDVEAEEVLAVTKGLFGLFSSKALAPVAGTVESVSTVTGKLILREPPIPLEVAAYVDGRVVEVLPTEGVVVETSGSFAQGIFGIGGEAHGTLHVAVDAPDQELTEAHLEKIPAAGAIVVGGSHVSRRTLERARDLGARGIVIGGFSDQDLRDFLGYDLGVAITGQEDIGLTLVVTEGFGRMPMAPRTFELLQKNSGRTASLNGATQIRAGVMRPEVIVPRLEDPLEVEAQVGDSQRSGLGIGTLIRVIRQPNFGRIGKVAALPAELQALESEARVRVLEVDFGGGERSTLPRANVEMIEG